MFTPLTFNTRIPINKSGEVFLDRTQMLKLEVILKKMRRNMIFKM